VPLLTLYAAAGLAARPWPARNRRALAGAAVILVVLATFWIRQVIFTDVARVRALLQHF
jgi:hypothetical protein